MLWLERLTRHDDEGRAHWEVLAVQRIPTPAENESVVYVDCIQGDASEGGDGYTFAVAQYEDAEILTRVRSAWKVDTQQQRFIPLPASEVECINEGYGE